MLKSFAAADDDNDDDDDDNNDDDVVVVMMMMDCCPSMQSSLGYLPTNPGLKSFLVYINK